MKAQRTENGFKSGIWKINIVFPKYNFHIMNTLECAADRQGPLR